MCRDTNTVHLEDFPGFYGDGGTPDDAGYAAAIATALALGRNDIVVPPCSSIVTQPITLGDPSGKQAPTFLNLRGSGLNTTNIIWHGAPNGVCVQLVRNQYYRLQDLTIRNGTGARGTTTGLLLTGYGGSGTETYGGVFDHISVDSFSTGIQAGVTPGVSGSQVAVAASDTSWQSIWVRNCDIGWQNAEGNSYNHFLRHFNPSGNGIGLNQLASGNIHIDGGSCSQNGIDFQFSGTNCSVANVRTELSQGSTGIHFVAMGCGLVQNCVTDGATDPTTYAMQVDVARFLAVQSCWWLAKIGINAYVNQGGLCLFNNCLNGDVTVPVFFGLQAGQSRANFLGNCNNNGVNSGSLLPYPDFAGTISPQGAIASA